MEDLNAADKTVSAAAKAAAAIDSDEEGDWCCLVGMHVALGNSTFD